MPVWLTDNLFKTMRYFANWISIQAGEAVFVLFRKWKGSWIIGTPSSYVYNSEYERWEFWLYQPPTPLVGGKPRLQNLQMYLDGARMSAVPQYNLTTSNLDFYVELDMGGPKGGDEYSGIAVGFHTGLNPVAHIVEFRYEEICHCISVTETSFHPNSRCTTCYGTGYVGGYDQYISVPEYECGRLIRPTNTALCRFPITTEAVKISRYGAEVVTPRRSWMVAGPLLHDWDILIRLRAFGAPMNVDPETGTIPNERYFITEWQHSSARASYSLPLPAQPGFPAVERGVTLHQKFSTVEIQPQHIAYQVPFSVV